jgi:hypothetical protein
VAPGFGEARDIDVEIAPRLQQSEAFGERLHHAVLDAVVDHLREVPGAARAAMQPAALRVGREQLRERLENFD